MIAALLAAAGLGLSAGEEPPQGEALFAHAEGAWGLPVGAPGYEELGCDTEPIRIEIDAGARRYVVRHHGTATHAAILGHGPGWFHLRYDDEARLDSSGGPVSWYWVYAGPDSFYWVRNDWLDTGGRTAPRVRCVNGQIG